MNTIKRQTRAVRLQVKVYGL